jgi:protein-disulfide isomerase
MSAFALFPSLRRASVATLLTLASFSALVACNKTNENPIEAPATPAEVAAATPEAAKPTVDTTGATEADCDAYAKTLCEVAGGPGATCESITTTLKILPPAACKAGMGDIEYSKTKLAEVGKVCNELMDRLCKDLGESTETCKMVRTKTPEFGAARCTKMLGEYDQVLGQLKQMEDANKPIAPEVFAQTLRAGAGEFGKADSKVVIVEFSDFQCPYCVRAADATKELKKKYADKIRLVFRQFPLSFHQNAHLAAQASLEALAQGKFWEMHDKMFANQKELERPALDKYAQEIGLDMKKFKAALDSGTHKAAVDADMELGQKVGVQGTPSMFINGEKVADPSNAAALGQKIDELLAR